MMQALVVKDTFDNTDMANSLREELKNTCSKIVEIESLNQLEIAKLKLDPNEPCLFYPNIFIRHRNIPLSKLLSFHKNTACTYLLSKNPTHDNSTQIVSFIPSRVTKNNKTDTSFSAVPYSSFYLRDLKFEYTYGQEQPMLFLYTHNRADYLKLTLNSLQYSIITPFPIKILLNHATEDVKKIVTDFAKDKGYVEILEITPNSLFSAINLAIQWFRPKKFILMEDDFILPVASKTYFPNWAYQFMDRLEYFDMVGWSWSSENSPPFFKSSRNVENCLSDWVIDYQNGYGLGGHCLALNTDFYLKAVNKRMSRQPINPYYVAFDGDMQEPTTKVCIPSLKGYHIGFNQQMDGYPVRTVDTNHPHIYKVKSLTTNEERNLNIEDLLKNEGS